VAREIIPSHTTNWRSMNAISSHKLQHERLLSQTPKCNRREYHLKAVIYTRKYELT
jgi:hypothetical protein